MAAPMKTARIGLSFDKTVIENSWFLVDFSKHKKVGDVASEIINLYFNCVTDAKKAVVLRTNNFLLPSNGSSELFRENDIVSVRLETCKESDSLYTESGDAEAVAGTRGDCSSGQIFSSQSMVEDENSGHTRKRKHSETDSGKKHKSSKHSKKKKRDKHLSENELELDLSENIHMAEKSKVHNKTLLSDCEDKVECQAGTGYSKDSSRMGMTIDDITNNDRVEQRKSKSMNKSEKVESEEIPLTDRNNSADSKSEYQQEVADNNEVGNVNDEETEMTVENDDLLSQSDVSSIDSVGKKKRNRHRKRRRRNPLTMTQTGEVKDTTVDSSKLNDSYQPYKSREVDKSESGLYGSLPDKLEPPRYYRHGYRNLNTYSVEPNKHTKFESDSNSDETEESTQQYNFLCKLRKLSETDISGGFEFNHETEDGAQRKIKTTETVFREETMIDEPMSVRNESQLLQNGIIENRECNEQPNEKFTAVPFNYANTSAQRSIDSGRDNIADIETSPVTLERKTLSNGVSVFVRQRGSPGSPYRGFSRQEQLDTKLTNVSTIFVNTQDPGFKVPSSPAPRQKVSPKPCNPVVKDSIRSSDKIQGVTPGISELNGSLTSTHNLQRAEPSSQEIKNSLTSTNNTLGVELSRCKPLDGKPKAGDTIAYKVLEISATCTPEVSGYKIAKVLSINNKQMLELKSLHEPESIEKLVTKFDVEIEDDNEILTNTEGFTDIVSLHLSSLLEPRVVTSTQ